MAKYDINITKEMITNDESFFITFNAVYLKIKDKGGRCEARRFREHIQKTENKIQAFSDWVNVVN